ncbi:MAG: cytochrome ubiquinol oxidase subunit I [Acidilobus sp.]
MRGPQVNVWTQLVSYGFWDLRALSIIGIGLHWGILQYVLGLPFMAFIAELIYFKTKDEDWMRIAKVLVKATAIVFAVGAATGTLVEFGLITVWPRVLAAVGKWLYFPMYAEVFAFIMEVLVIYMLWYGWDKLSPKARLVLTFFAFIGPWYSGAMIVAANSYMQVPTGLVPDYNPYTGQWLYSEGYPKILVAIPTSIASLLNVTTLQSLGVQIKGTAGNVVLAYVPVKIVDRLVYESFAGYTLNQSVLRLVLKAGALNDPGLASTPVLTVLTAILDATVKYYNPYAYLFESPDFVPSLMHSIGAGLVVSGFTTMAAYGTRLMRAKDERYRRYLEKAFKFAIVFSLVAIAYEGLIAGHEMGVTVAKYQPEKFAAIEGLGVPGFTSIAEIFHTGPIEKLLAYGTLSAHLPKYGQIPPGWGNISSTLGVPGTSTYLPPLIVDYTYYAMVFIGIALGVYALILTGYVALGRTARIHRVWLYLLIPAAVLAQFASYMGWATREIGRLPWVVYGVMTLSDTVTVNQPPAWGVALYSVFYVLLGVSLVYAVYRFLWVPSRSERLEPV